MLIISNVCFNGVGAHPCVRPDTAETFFEVYPCVRRCESTLHDQMT